MKYFRHEILFAIYGTTHSQSFSAHFQSLNSVFRALWLPCQQLGGMATVVDVWRAGEEVIGSVWEQPLRENLNTSIHSTV